LTHPVYMCVECRNLCVIMHLLVYRFSHSFYFHRLLTWQRWLLMLFVIVAMVILLLQERSVLCCVSSLLSLRWRTIRPTRPLHCYDLCATPTTPSYLGRGCRRRTTRASRTRLALWHHHVVITAPYWPRGWRSYSIVLSIFSFYSELSKSSKFVGVAQQKCITELVKLRAWYFIQSVELICNIIWHPLQVCIVAKWLDWLICLVSCA